MRVLLVNKFYYRRGGDCVYLLNLEQMLHHAGIETAVYSMHYADNLPSPWQGRFAPEVSFGGGVGTKLRALRRTMGHGDIRSSFVRMLSDFRPDVVHLGNIHSYLSPQLARMAHDFGARVVWTLHDYKLLCPSYACLNNGKHCEQCFGRDKLPVVKNRCMKGSLSASVIAWLEAMKWNRGKIGQWVDAFICPSQFMAGKMAQGGFDPAKLHVINNFISPEMLQRLDAITPTPRQDYYCYVGRLSEEKGVETLLRAASALTYTLRIAGTGPLEHRLRHEYAHCPNIHFLGRQDAESVINLLSRARLSVVPSEWYENNPFSAIESLCAGTPVAGARIGGIPELINTTNGLTFESGDTQALTQAVAEAMTHTWQNHEIASQAKERFSPNNYFLHLNKIYQGENTL